MSQFQQIRGKSIVIDTNIPIRYATDDFRERSGNFLRTLANNDNNLLISDVTTFELLSGDPKDGRRKYYTNFINYLFRIEVSTLVLQNSIILNNEYRKYGCKHNIPLPDLIIGGTVVGIKDCCLLTADRNDFCEPLWKTVDHLAVFNRDGMIDQNIYLLEYNLSISK